MIYRSIAFLVLFLFFLYIFSKDKKIKKKKPKLFIFGYALVYSDARENSIDKGVVKSKLLKSEKYDITGKPDYIFKKYGSKKLIPVELKSGEIKNRDMPHKGDLLQLGAYFLIIEEIYGVRPKKGHLIYSDYMFVVKNTSAIRNDVKSTLNAMRKMLKDGSADVSPSFAECRYCICRGTVCEHYESQK